MNSRKTRLAVSVLLVGTFVIGAAGAGQGAAVAAVRQPASGLSELAGVKLASFNTFLMYTSLYPNWGQEKRASLMLRDHVLAGRDVVFLNELFDEHASTTLLDGLRAEYPYQTPVVGRTKSGWDETLGSYSNEAVASGGVAIVSRYPILSQNQFVFKTGCGWDGTANKGFAHARLDTPGGIVNVIATHPQSDDSACLTPPAGVRRAQFAALKEYIDSRIPKTEALYVGGDFNTDATEYGEVSKLLGSVPSSVVGPESYSPTTNDIASYNAPGGPDQQLDYVVPVKGYKVPSTWTITTKANHSEEWCVSSWAQCYCYHNYSDHYPVFANS